MHLKDQVGSEAEWQAYEQLLRQLSAFLDDFIHFASEAFRTAEAKVASDRRPHHATVFVLARHVLESVDAVTVLTEKGCAQPCGPILRSAFEGMIGVQYVMQAESERRGLAYQVAHAHRRIKLYRKCDAADTAGQELRANLRDDPLAAVLDRLPAGLAKRSATLEGMLTRPEYAPVEREWQAIRKKRKSDPPWFSLFGGPPDIQRLAERVGYSALYEFVYRQWSDIIHAGSGFNNIGQTDGVQVYRPLRHPEGLQAAVSTAAAICLATVNQLINGYAPEEADRFRTLYMDKLRTRYQELGSDRQLIMAPWQ